MPVRKFKDVSEMPGPAPRPRLDPDNLRLASELSTLARRLARVHTVPGVRRYPSVEAMWQDQDRRGRDRGE